MDPSIQPGDDFFAYANGAWLKATEIPAGKERWNARDEIDELTRQQIAKLLDDAGAAPAGSIARKVADFRAAYLNEAAIEARGIAPLKPLLDSIDRVRDKAELTRLLGRGLAADVDPLNWGVYRSSSPAGSVGGAEHPRREDQRRLSAAGGLGLPDREYYVSTEPGMQALRARYREYIGRLLALAGFDRAEQRAEAVMALETALAQSQATREASANDHNADNVWTRADFARRAPGMDWSAFFAAAGLARQETFVAWQPTAVTVWRRWSGRSRWRRGRTTCASTSRRFRRRAAARLRRAGAGAAWRRDGTGRQPSLACRARARGDAGGDERRRREDVRRALFPGRAEGAGAGDRGQRHRGASPTGRAATWMSPGTRRVALAKLQTLYVGIGYPDGGRTIPT